MEADDNLISIFPNPAREYINIYVANPSSNLSVEVYNAIGKKIAERNLTSSNNSMSIQNFPAGIYVFRVRNGNRNFATKVIIEK